MISHFGMDFADFMLPIADLVNMLMDLSFKLNTFKQHNGSWAECQDVYTRRSKQRIEAYVSCSVVQRESSTKMTVMRCHTQKK